MLDDIFTSIHVDYFSPESSSIGPVLPNHEIIEDKDIAGSESKNINGHPDSKITKEDKEHTETGFDLERGQQFGTFYQGFIGRVLEGEFAVDTSVISNEEDRMLAEGMVESAASGFKTQAIKVELAQMDARDILSQAFQTAEQQKLLDDTSRYTLNEHAKGVYEIELDRELFEDLYGSGAQAVAVSSPDIVSFVMIPRFSGEHNAETNKRHVEENLPHETHHIAWKFMERDNLFSNTEENPEMAKAFRMYRDEIIAKMVTDNGPHGYDHLTQNPDRKRRLQEESPELYSSIRSSVIGMNELMREIRDVISRSPVKYRDLIFPAIQTSNFSELRTKFESAKDYIDTNSEPEQRPTGPTTSAWGTIISN